MRSRTMAQVERALLSTVSVEDYVHDALHLVEINRVQGAVVTDVTMVMCLDLASPVIRCLELTLNDEIGPDQPRRISDIVTGIFGLERTDNSHRFQRRRRISREIA